MNIYRDEVVRVLRLGDLEDEDGQQRQQQKGEGEGWYNDDAVDGKNVTRKDKKKSATKTAAKKNNSIKKPPSQVAFLCVSGTQL